MRVSQARRSSWKQDHNEVEGAQKHYFQAHLSAEWGTEKGLRIDPPQDRQGNELKGISRMNRMDFKIVEPTGSTRSLSRGHSPRTRSVRPKFVRNPCGELWLHSPRHCYVVREGEGLEAWQQLKLEFDGKSWNRLVALLGASSTHAPDVRLAWEAMPCKFGVGVTLHHSPTIYANKVFKLKTMQNICQNFGVLESSLGSRQFPVNPSIWRTFLWIVVCGRQCAWVMKEINSEEFLRFLGNVNVETIETCFIMVQKHIQGATDQLDWKSVEIGFV